MNVRDLLISNNKNLGSRSVRLFAAVVLVAIDDAIKDQKENGNGDRKIANWARSIDGSFILSCAGIEPNERVVTQLVDFVLRGVRTSQSLSRNRA